MVFRQVNRMFSAVHTLDFEGESVSELDSKLVGGLQTADGSQRMAVGGSTAAETDGRESLRGQKRLDGTAVAVGRISRNQR